MNTKKFVRIFALISSLLIYAFQPIYALKTLKILPLEQPNIFIANTNLYFVQGGGVSATYERALTENIALGLGIGLIAGQSAKKGPSYFQYIFPVYANFYPASSKDYHHRFIIVTTATPFLDINPIKNYSGVDLGVAIGYEFRNERGFLCRITGGALVPLVNPLGGQTVVGHFRVGFGTAI